MSIAENWTRKDDPSHGGSMEFVKIPGTALTVSRIALGTWAIGGWMWGGTDEAESIATIRAPSTHGINLIDTAPVYGFGRSEEIVGKALADGLRTVILATKVGLEWKDGKIFRNCQPDADHARRSRIRCGGCGPTIIDVYQVHWPDPNGADRGDRRRRCAALDARARSAPSASAISRSRRWTLSRGRAASLVQPPYNLFEREIEAEILPYCRRTASRRLAMARYAAACSPAGCAAETQFKGDDLRQNDPKFQPPRFAQYLAAVERLDRLAQERYGKRVIHLAVRWLLDQGITTALWGARRPDQLEPVEASMGGRSSRRQGEIDRILPRPSPIRWGPSSWRRRHEHKSISRGEAGSSTSSRPSRRECSMGVSAKIAEVEGCAYLMLLPSQPPHTHRCPDPTSMSERTTVANGRPQSPPAGHP